jgi:hypothetical protein
VSTVDTFAYRAEPRPTALVGMASVLSLAAAAIHFAVIGEHLEEYRLFGVFFACVAWLQALWAVGIVVRPSRPMLFAGAAANLGLVVLWAVSRTVGLPIGPEPWQPEAVSLVDLVSSAAEAAIAAVCVAQVMARARVLAHAATTGAAAVATFAITILATAALLPTTPGSTHEEAEAVTDEHPVPVQVMAMADQAGIPVARMHTRDPGEGPTPHADDRASQDRGRQSDQTDQKEKRTKK